MVLSLPLSEAIKNISFGLLFLCFIIQRVLKRDLYLTPLARGLFFYFVTALLILPFAIDKYLSLKGAWDIFRFSAAYLILINDFRDKRSWIEWSLIIGTTLGALWGIFVWKLMWHKHALQILSLGHFNHTAIFLGLVLILCICKLIWDNLSVKVWFFLCFSSFIIATALLLTTSRETFVGFGAACIFLLFSTKDKRLVLPTLGFIFLLLSVSFFYKDLQTKGFSTESLKSRFHIWAAGLRTFKDHPLVGVGLNCFKKIDIKYYGKYPNDWAPHAHNLYVNTLAQMGIIGFLGLLAVFFGFIKTALTRAKSYLKLAAVASLILVLVNGIFNTTLHHEHALAFVIISALM